EWIEAGGADRLGELRVPLVALLGDLDSVDNERVVDALAAPVPGRYPSPAPDTWSTWNSPPCSTASCSASSVLVGLRGLHAGLDQVHDRRVLQRRDVTQGTVLRHVAQQPPHDLPGPRLRQLRYQHDLARLADRAERTGDVA